MFTGKAASGANTEDSKSGLHFLENKRFRLENFAWETIRGTNEDECSRLQRGWSICFNSITYHLRHTVNELNIKSNPLTCFSDIIDHLNCKIYLERTLIDVSGHQVTAYEAANTTLIDCRRVINDALENVLERLVCQFTQMTASSISTHYEPRANSKRCCCENHVTILRYD